MSDDNSSSSKPKLKSEEENDKSDPIMETIHKDQISQINKNDEEEKDESIKQDSVTATTTTTTCSFSTTTTSSTTTSSSTTSSSSSSSFGGWFSNFVQSAKDKVNKTTMDSIRRDLNELKDAVQLDTTQIVYSTASIVKNTINEIGNSVQEISSLGTNSGDNDDDVNINDPKVKTEIQSKNQDKDDEDEDDDDGDDSKCTSSTVPFDLKTINSWTEKLTDTAKSTISMVKDTLVDSIFATFPVEELDEEPFVVKQGKIIKIENWKQLLKQLQCNAQTYCNEPEGPLDDFDQWLVKFNLINHQKQIQHLLQTVPELKNYYEEFVIKNATLTETDFWNRYFYKVYQLKEQQCNLILNSKNDSNEDNAISTVSSSGSTTSTEDWEKMSTTAIDNNNAINNNNQTATSDQSKPSSSTSENDDDREWVKCD